MRWLKNSIILVSVLIILIGVLIIYKGHIRKSSTMFLLPENADISEICIDSVDIVKKDNEWMIKSPIDYRVDEDYIISRLRELKKLELGDYVIVDSSYYSDYGFGEGSERVSIFFDSDSIKFRMGKSAATPGAFFLKKIGDKGIYTAYGFGPYLLSNKVNDWRDKSIVFINRNKVDSLRVYKYKKLIFKGIRGDSIFNKALKQAYRTKAYEFPDTTKEKFPYKVILYAFDKTNSFNISKQIGSYYILKNDSTIFKVYSSYITNFLNTIQKK